MSEIMPASRRGSTLSFGAMGALSGGQGNTSLKTMAIETLKLCLFSVVCFAIYAQYNGNTTNAEWSMMPANQTAVTASTALDLDILPNQTTGVFFMSKVGGGSIEWSFVDCIYFAMETVTTVGYGDIAPGNDSAKVVTIFVCLFGVGAISGSITTIASWFLTQRHKKQVLKQKKLLQEAIAINQLQQEMSLGNDSDDDGCDAASEAQLLAYFEDNPSQKAAYEKLPPKVQAAAKGAFLNLSQNLDQVKLAPIQGGGVASTAMAEKCRKATAYAKVINMCFIPLYLYIVACFALGHIEGWSGLDCIYFSIITMTTVGFGDVAPVSQDARLFASFLLPAGLMALTLVVGLTGSELKKLGVTNEKGILDLLNELKEVIAQDDDGTVTEEEYLIFCLKQQQKVDQDTLDILRKQFQALDADGSGELDEDDVKQLTIAAMSKSQRQRRTRMSSNASSKLNM